MHHCKRTKLKVSDLNMGFEMFNVQVIILLFLRNSIYSQKKEYFIIKKIFGYLNNESYKYNRIKFHETNDRILSQFKTDFYEVNDELVELKLSKMSLKNEYSQNAGLIGKWLISNGHILDSEQKFQNDISGKSYCLFEIKNIRLNLFK
jgi:hypothetical protein